MKEPEMRRLLIPRMVLVVALSLAFGAASLRSAPQSAAPESVLTRDAVREFLLTAKVVRSQSTSKGVTRPSRLTLSNGTLTHDAAFSTVDERKTLMEFDRGKSEINFVDSYHYNIAAYEISELLGLDYMMPMSVEREWQGKRGALTWWVDEVMMDEQERLKKKTPPPDIESWNQQMFRMRVFSQLVYDTDRNLGNVLITKDWKIWMIDFTRAFRQWKKLPSPGDLSRCDKELLARLRQLKAEDVEAKTRPHLSPYEIDALMARRDLLVEHFEKLIAARGEKRVLY
jgi:hypothetical protein